MSKTKSQHPQRYDEQPDPSSTTNTHHDAYPKLTTHLPPTPPASPMSLHLRPYSPKPVRLLLASLGNPPPYHLTRHSAGHILLSSFASHLSFPPFSRHKPSANGLLSSSPSAYPVYTLWQCPTQMNVSGPAVLAAWSWFTNAVSKDIGGGGGDDDDGEVVTGLVLVHDELELPLGQLKLRKGDASAKGHNGVKSVQQSLRSAGEMGKLTKTGRFLRVAVGIGRPESRVQRDVSEFVLGKLGVERGKVEAAAGEMGAVLEGVVERLSLGK